MRCREAWMELPSSIPKRALLEELRRRRAALFESMSAVEHALAAPAPGLEARWVEGVQGALVELSADFRAHIDITEGPDGLYREPLLTAPRLSGAVARLIREHALIKDLLDDLTTSVGEPDINPDV